MGLRLLIPSYSLLIGEGTRPTISGAGGAVFWGNAFAVPTNHRRTGTAIGGAGSAGLRRQALAVPTNDRHTRPTIGGTGTAILRRQTLPIAANHLLALRLSWKSRLKDNEKCENKKHDFYHKNIFVD